MGVGGLRDQSWHDVASVLCNVEEVLLRVWHLEEHLSNRHMVFKPSEHPPVRGGNVKTSRQDCWTPSVNSRRSIPMKYSSTVVVQSRDP